MIDRGTSRKMKGLALVLFTVLFLTSGCATVGTVMWDVKKPEFQEENHPIRDINLVVYSNGFHSNGSIRELIADTSHELERQVGIRLVIKSIQPIEWDGTSSTKRLNTLYKRAKKDFGDKFDMAIGFGWHTPADLILMNVIGNWMAAIDDTYRRYIVVKTSSKYALTHELCHAFIFSHGHSSTGLMQGVQISLLPGTSGINRTIYLSPKDRKEVLKNKWRDFNKRPQLRDKDRSDFLEEDKEE